MAKPKSIVVSALAGVPGRQFDGGALFDAIETAVRAAAAGYEGRIFCAMDDGSIKEFDRPTKSFIALGAWPF